MMTLSCLFAVDVGSYTLQYVLTHRPIFPCATIVWSCFANIDLLQGRLLHHERHGMNRED